MQEVKTLIDKFDFSDTMSQAELWDILRFVLSPRDRLIMNFRLGCRWCGQHTVMEIAALLETDCDSIIAVESRVCKILDKRGVPRKA